MSGGAVQGLIRWWGVTTSRRTMKDEVFYESLSRDERIRRVGVLFLKVATIICQRTAPERLSRKEATLNEATAKMVSPKWEEYETALLQRYSGFGAFSPHEAMLFWGISRTSCYRRLKKLEDCGWIRRMGRTSAVKYALAGETQIVLKQLRRA